MKKRDSNFELLRILAMLMIIAQVMVVSCYHPELADVSDFELRFDHFSFAEFYKVLLLPECLIPFGYAASIIFMMISGFFLVEQEKMNLRRRGLKILGQTGFTAVALAAVSALYNRLYSGRLINLQGMALLNQSWNFVGYYMGIVAAGYFFLNALLRKIDRKTYAAILISLFALFSFSGTGEIMDSLAAGLRTLTVGIFAYALGGYIRKYEPFKNVRSWLLIASVFVLLLLSMLSYYNESIRHIETYLGENSEEGFAQYRSSYHYYDLVPVLLAMIIFEIVRRIRISSSSVINFIASASFVVYLILDTDLVIELMRTEDMVILLHNSPVQFISYILKWAGILYLLGIACNTCFLGMKWFLSRNRGLWMVSTETDNTRKKIIRDEPEEKYSHRFTQTVRAVWSAAAKYSKLWRVCFAGLLCAVLFFCWQTGSRYEAEKNRVPHEIPASDADMETDYPYLSVSDVDRNTTPENPVIMNAPDLISKGGDYILAGKMKGTVRVDAKEQIVHLFLEDVDLASVHGPAILVENAEKVILTLIGENHISDSGDYRGAEIERDACIYSSASLTLNGTGSLSLSGLYSDGIRSKDVIKILGGTYRLKTKRSAVYGNDGIYIDNGDFLIESEKYGFKTSKSGAEGRGNLMIAGGDLRIITGRFAFVTVKADLYIYDCTVQTSTAVGDYSIGGESYIQAGCVL